MRAVTKQYSLVIRATPLKQELVRTLLLGLANGFVYGSIKGVSSFELREKKDGRKTV